MSNPSDLRSILARMHNEIVDGLDEELEMEIDDERLDALINPDTRHEKPGSDLDRHTYFKELLRLQKMLLLNRMDFLLKLSLLKTVKKHRRFSFPFSGAQHSIYCERWPLKENLWTNRWESSIAEMLLR
jgi:hypothetical protein